LLDVTQVPLFPLNTVIFPGVVTPLHIFEDRYRALVRELAGIESVFDRVFGILAIREGYEVGDHGMQSAHRIGTLVQLTEVEAYDDGRFDIEVIGRQRLQVTETDSSGEFLRGEVELIPDTDEPEAEEEAELARSTFEVYRDQLSELRGGPVLSGDLPSDPAYLSYALASTCLLTLPQRQALLEADSAQLRLGMLRRTLHEEMRAMRALPSLPATEVARTRWSPN
jgi:Lon protease-like protein